MAHDILSQFYTSLNLPIQEKLVELIRIIDQSTPNKDLQALFPELISNIFGTSFGNGWGLRHVTLDTSRYEYEILLSFFEPMGPMFRLCYKLMSDPQLRYNLPVNVLPLDLQMTLERGRCSQFYADMLTMDSQSPNIIALSLNPFDYYIFNFALNLVSNSQNKSSWENWNSVYFTLACDFLMHFLPADPNVPVLPLIPNYTGKVPMAAPLQTANRPHHSPSLLLIQDLSGLSNQPTSPQSQSRHEVWRSETVLQVFIDIWMSVEQFGDGMNADFYQKVYPVGCSSPERVRTVRVLVKHIHSFSAKHLSDPAVRSSALRKYARQVMCARAYHYVKHLVTTWPLDASFRLVMELWLSLIQPWRYANNNIQQDRFPNNNNQEEANTSTLDSSYSQFIAENFPSYTCIFQLVLPRFMRLDLTANKNAVMLFRLGKVFAQPHLVPILWNLEHAIMDITPGFHNSPDSSFNNSINMDQSYTYNGIALNKWAAIAKQAISEMNLSANFEYDPIWSEQKKPMSTEFVKKIYSAKLAAEKYFEDYMSKMRNNHQGMWSSIKQWFLITNNEEEVLLEEYRKATTYLNNSIHYFSNIFCLNELTIMASEPIIEDTSAEQSSYANSSSFALNITNKLRSKNTDVHYMGDPDLMPITSYESTILVRILYQIATRLNEIYQDEFTNLWNKDGFLGYVAREILQKPCTIQNYVKEVTNHQNIIRQNLPARLSLRRLGSHAVVFWVFIGYMLFRLFSYSGLFYTFVLIFIWTFIILTKASLKYLNLVNV